MGNVRSAWAVVLAGASLAAGCGSASGEADSSSPRSGISGQAVILVCGGASEGGQGCRRHPVTATIVVRRMPSRRQITAVRTDASGRFRVDLPPGVYQLQARTSSAAAVARVATARVRPRRITHATVTLVPRHPLPLAPGAAPG